MVTLPMLWLPILLSAVAVLIVANVLWMALPFWHNADYGRVPEEKPILDALSTAKSGQYLVPRVDWRKLSAEERQAMESRPVVYMLVRNPAKFSFGPASSSIFSTASRSPSSWATSLDALAPLERSRSRSSGLPAPRAFSPMASEA